MNFLGLKDISERYLELVNPISSEKVLAIGEVAGLTAGQKVIEFGCGYGEVLALWAERFGISGVGMDIREQACQRARQKMVLRGLDERIQIVHGSGSEYHFERGAFDLAACIGASFIWDGYRQALSAMKPAIRPGGKIAIGEPYWTTEAVPPEFAQNQSFIHTEVQLLQIARQENLELEYVVRASQDDWDHYEANNWRGLLRWLEENPNHPERQEVIDHLRESQDEYFHYGRKYFGWAIYLLNPVK
jgi:cyclopropane fatty-acyl-phospholipid synthase-like methyltransferase